MSKPIKRMVTGYLKNRFEDQSSACVVDLTGLDVASTQAIRTGLRENNARMEVVKNRLARQAFNDTPLQPLGEVLSGPCALVTVEDDTIIDVAKKLVELSKKYKSLKLKTAIFDGDPDLLTVQDMSKMKSLGDLLGEIAGLIGGPGRLVAGAVSAPQAKIAGCLKAIADK